MKLRKIISLKTVLHYHVKPQNYFVIVFFKLIQKLSSFKDVKLASLPVLRQMTSLSLKTDEVKKFVVFRE